MSGFRSLRKALKQKLDQQSSRSKTKRKYQQSSDTNALFVPLSERNNSNTVRSANTSNFSAAEHRAHVQRLISKWCAEYKEHFGLEEFKLEDGVGFTFAIEFDENLNVGGKIKCKCNKSISLAKNDSKLQVSNFNKHLLSTGCE